MKRGRKRKSSLSELNRSFELLTEIVRLGSPLLEKLLAPRVPVSTPPPTLPMGVAFDPYEIFTLPKNASEQEFKLRYRELMRKVHSDHGGSDALAKIINVAWDQIRKEKGWK